MTGFRRLLAWYAYGLLLIAGAWSLIHPVASILDVDMGGDYPARSASAWDASLSIGKLLVSCVPVAAALFAGAVLCGALAGRVYRQPRLPAISRRTVRLLAAGISLLTFAVLYYLRMTFSGGIPHVPDAWGYLFQAKILATGRLSIPDTPFINASPQQLHQGGRIFSQYPFGHPLVLAAGCLLGNPNLIPPMLSAVSVFTVYFIGELLYSPFAGLAAALLLGASPFFQMQGVDFMSHNTMLAATLLCTLCYLSAVRSRSGASWWWLGCGAATGMMLVTRPYTALFILLPFAADALRRFRAGGSRYRRGMIIWGAAGLLPFAVAYAAYNLILSGDAVRGAYSLGFLNTFGFNRGRPFTSMLLDINTNLYLLTTVLFGWPQAVTFAFVLLALVLPGDPSRWLFAGSIVSLGAGYALYKGSWVMYGPRMWFEATGFLVLLTVSGIRQTADAALRAGPAALRMNAASRRAVIVAVLSLITAGLSGSALVSWYSSAPSRGSWNVDFTPKTVGDLPGFNYANTALLTKVAASGIHHAVIFLDKEPNWWYLDIPASTMDVSMQGDIIYVPDKGRAANEAVIAAYPGRAYYRASYKRATVRPYGMTADPAGEDR